MGHIQDRWYKTVKHPDGTSERIRTQLHGRGERYKLRYIGPDGREKSESFPDRQKRRAEARLVEVESEMQRGVYINPIAGKVTFKRYADEWLASATCGELTHDRLEYEFRLHVYPELGAIPIAQIQPSTIRAWARSIHDAGLSVGYQRRLFSDVATVFNAAVDDKKISSNPFAVKTVKPPREQPTRVVPWSIEQRRHVRDSLPARYRLAVDLGSGCGLRQGEIFAISPHDIDPARPVLHVRRQLKIVRRQLIFGLPKGDKVREVPLPDSVARRHARPRRRICSTTDHLAVGTSVGDPVTVTLYLYTTNLNAINRPTFNKTAWKRAIRAAGVEDSRENGMHVLRHTYASVLLDAGESVKALASYLGHSDPGLTLRIYTHLLPSSEDRTRRAIDSAFADEAPTADGLETA